MANAASSERFEFGKNWTRYVKRSFSEERVDIARRHMLKLLKREDLKGLDFLDIGCGSGIHSMAALQAGAGEIRSSDYDPNSVQAAKMVRGYAGNPKNWVIERGDVLDENYIDSLGKWNLVYSWGVLHHTGDVWRALELAQRPVADGGLFYIALYSSDVQTDPDYWLRIKQEYNQAGAFERWRMVWWYVWEHMMAKKISHFPIVFMRMVNYRFSRGMSLFSDIRDWLGGWPMQFVADKDVIDLLEQKHGMKLLNIKTGEACTEFVFERLAKQNA
jgi:SAM-dependent methyltransferase